MYIHKIGIKHIRSIREFNMEFPLGEEAGWHVILAANGMGKSTLISEVLPQRLLGQKNFRLYVPSGQTGYKKAKMKDL